jgi:hypothetical protein
MKILRFSRTWWMISAAVVVLVAAGPTAGRVAEPSPNDWSVATTPNPGVWGNIILGMSARTVNDVWAVGIQETETSNGTLAIHWNGANWTAVPTPNPSSDCQDGNIQWTGQALHGVDAVSATDVWVVGSGCYDEAPIIEHWDGSSWSLVAGARHSKGFDSMAALYDVAAISASNVWAVGYQGTDDFSTYIDHWNGTSWSEAASPGGSSNYFTSISATGPNDIWAVGLAGGGHNLIEHFDGSSWSVVASPQPAGASGLDSVTAISPTDAWAVGSKRGTAPRESTFTLHWNGSTWSEVPSPNPSNAPSATNQLRSVAALSPNNVWAVGMYENEQTNFHQNRTLVLHWDGLSWSIVASPTPGLTGELTAVAARPSPLAVRQKQIFAGGFFSYYERNIYDGHYTDPRTLVIDG